MDDNEQDELLFMIKGRGDEVLGLSSVLSSNILDETSLSASGSTSIPSTNSRRLSVSSISTRSPIIKQGSRKDIVSSIKDDVDIPITWDIIHNANITIDLLPILEDIIQDVKFLCLYDVPHLTSMEKPTIIPHNDANIDVINDHIILLKSLSKLCVYPHSHCPHPILIQEKSLQRKGSVLQGDRDISPRRGDPSAEFEDEDMIEPAFERDSGKIAKQGYFIGVDISQISDIVMPSSCAKNPGNKLNESIQDYLRNQVISITDRMEYFLMPYEEIMDHLYGCKAPVVPTDDMNIKQDELSLSDHNDNDDDAYTEDDGYTAPKTYDSNPSSPKKAHELDAEYTSCFVKIVDLGNACWTHRHFTEDIQTRQYRCPEVIIGCSYDTPSDIWSIGCIVFELLTGDMLFDPQAGTSWSRDEDHLALMVELLGYFPKASVFQSGKFYHRYFNRKGEFRNISKLKLWGLKDVLTEKYKFSPNEAKEITDFITPMLQVYCPNHIIPYLWISYIALQIIDIV